MLKVHQTLGMITAIPMAAALLTGPQARVAGRNGQTITEPNSANLDFHIALGSLTSGLYWTTAYYSMFAPKVPGVKPKGAIRLHRDLEWVHGPGMILTGILGPHGLPARERWGEGTWCRFSTWPGCLCDGCGLWRVNRIRIMADSS